MADARSIQGVLIFILVAIVAAWLGVSVVTNQTETLVKVGGAGLLLICALMGRRIWLVFVFFVSMDVPLIRGINTAEIGQALFFGFSLMLFAVRRLQLRRGFGELEFWMVLVALCIIQAYLRNPVGLNIMGGGSVGGRPYLVAGITFVTGWLLSMLVVPPSEIRWAMRLTLIGKLVGAPLTDLRSNAGIASQGIEVGDSRVPWMGGLSLLALRWVMSKMSPFDALVRPLYLLLMLVALAAAAGSGYRNIVAGAGLTLMVGVFYHRGVMASMVAGVAGIVFIAILSLVNSINPLPGTMQRALSPFPGSWEERYVTDAGHSTEWRIAMWREALTTDTWIKNKLLGDGLGMTREELARLQDVGFGSNQMNMGSSGLTIQQENMMLTGSYHSGPVQSIRTVGYVGLIVIVLAMIRLATHFHRLIFRVKRTEWFQTVLFLAIPSLIYPIQFVFIYGDFKSAMSLLFFSFGLCRLMERNLPLRSAQPVEALEQLRGPFARPVPSLTVTAPR